jgi:hypothetical protein
MFPISKLTRDHVVPFSRGGRDVWMNVVTACRSCNERKSDRTPERAGMELVYLPYVPNRAEYLILTNRRILADQMEFLAQHVPAQSRLHQKSVDGCRIRIHPNSHGCHRSRLYVLCYAPLFQRIAMMILMRFI